MDEGEGAGATPTSPKFDLFLNQCYNLNKLGRGPLDEATYQISKAF